MVDARLRHGPVQFPTITKSRSDTSLGGHIMMTKRRSWVAAVAGLIALALPIGWAWGDNVRIEVTPQPQPPPSSTTVIVPPPAPPATQYVPAPPQVAVPMPPQTITADQIKANQVRADTIYANRIEADQVFGQVHQTKDVKIRD